MLSCVLKCARSVVLHIKHAITMHMLIIVQHIHEHVFVLRWAGPVFGCAAIPMARMGAGTQAPGVRA